MSCCQGHEAFFNKKVAHKNLKRYRKKGPHKVSQYLIEALKSKGLNGMTLLDIGGGIGSIQHELIKAGLKKAVSIDAPSAYINASKEEAKRQGHSDRVTYHQGDFVDLSDQVDSTDIVTLDKVICCYPDMEAIVSHSVKKAKKVYAIVFPRINLLMLMIKPILNLLSWLRHDPCRFYLHSPQKVESIIIAEGLERQSFFKTFVWQILLYERRSD
ncbi:MAG: hypothetical protein IEMM0008_1445 [bacterium]|nr:MAG: hypothetical protein IEMM0008_1445 [bacterium]